MFTSVFFDIYVSILWYSSLKPFNKSCFKKSVQHSTNLIAFCCTGSTSLQKVIPGLFFFRNARKFWKIFIARHLWYFRSFPGRMCMIPNIYQSLQNLTLWIWSELSDWETEQTCSTCIYSHPDTVSREATSCGQIDQHIIQYTVYYIPCFRTWVACIHGDKGKKEDGENFLLELKKGTFLIFIWRGSVTPTICCILWDREVSQYLTS